MNNDTVKSIAVFKILTVFASVLLIVYFGTLSEFLPRHGGPDEGAHKGAAAFIYENNRLPVYPQDRDELHYTPYGTTRSFRPPLIYISTAIVQEVADFFNLSFDFPFRKANAIFGGLTFLILTLAIFIYTRSRWLALILSGGFILMPQASFIYSYLNNEGAAFLASSLILLSVVLLLKRGVTTRTLLFFGMACGILSLSKLSAWAFSFPVFLFALYLIFSSGFRRLQSFLTITVSFLVVGGWRIIFNVFHHGIENPFNWILEDEITRKHTIVDWSLIPNHSKLGHGYLDLLSNINSFLSDTFYSTVGRIDWLILEFGPLQYILYGASFALMALSILLLAFARSKENSAGPNLNLWFEVSIVAGAFLLFFLYLYFNLYNDMQHQGKYIMPALPGLVLILASMINRMIFRRSWWLSRPALSTGTGVFFVVLISYTHFQAVYKYVISFYHSSFYVSQQAEFKALAFDEFKEIRTNNVEYELLSDKTLQYKISGADPWVLFVPRSPLSSSTGAVVIKLDIVAPHYGKYELYWNSGSGMAQANRVEGVVSEGENHIYRILPAGSIVKFRFDYGNPDEEVQLSRLAYAELKFKPLIPVLNRLFNVNFIEFRPLLHSFTSPKD